MKRVIRIVLPLALLILAGAGGWYWWTELRFRESTDNAYVRAQMAAISPEIEGRVTEVAVVDNQAVTAGDVLLRIEDRDFKAKLAQADAQVAARQAELAQISADRSVQDSTIRAAEATLARTRAEQDRAGRDLSRYQELVQRSNASKQQLDTASADAASAEAEVAAAEASLEAARAQIQVLDAREKSAQASLEMARAARDVAAIDLDRTVVKAPITGVVGNKGVQVGDHVKPGLVTMRLIPLDDIYVEANFKETQVGGMRVGGKVNLAIDAFPGQKVEGVIQSFAPASGSSFSMLPPENATGNFTKIVQRVPVKITLAPDNPLRGLLRPGLSVVVTADLRDMPANQSLALGGGRAAGGSTRLAGR